MYEVKHHKVSPQRRPPLSRGMELFLYNPGPTKDVVKVPLPRDMFQKAHDIERRV